jgi:CheY-like chemotaxis protein
VAHILVIDDNFDLRSSIKLMLESAGHHVEEATNGLEGIQQFVANPADLVITDIMMPEQDGLETLLQIRTDYPKVPLIVISGEAAEHLDLAREFGATHVLAKPFRLADLLAVVQNALS